MIYTKKHVYEETLKFFDGDDLATNVWIDKYALRDKEEHFLENNPMQMYERVASELSRIERTYDNPLSYGTILRLLLERKFIPAGSNLFGIGNDYQYTSLANCFVIGNTEDSYSGLLQTDAEQALLMKRRGGVGHDISHLRPKGSLVQNAAKTSTGSVSFMNRFSNTTREVGQGGRRGALMLTMIITHPDIFDFITAKDDLTKITGANISVRVTDEFMEAVKEDKDFVLRYPHISKLEGDIDELPLNETITNEYGYMFRKIKARQLWNVIVKQAHKNGEPGLLFWDNIVNNSPADCYEQFQTKSTNPCFSGEENLKTLAFGEQKFKDLVGKTVYIYNENGYSPASIWYSGKKDTITFRNGLGETTTCTPDHIWRLNDGTECMAKNLKGKRLMPYTAIYYPQIWSELYMKLGFIQGDGELGRLDDIKYPDHKGFTVNIGKNDIDILNLFGYKRTTENQRKWYTSEFYDICKELQFSEKPLPNRILPLTFNNWQPLLQQSFLRGLYSANGSIITGHRISIKSTCKEFILQLQEVLKKFNITSYYTTCKNHLVKFDNGEYECKTSYDLNISRYNSILAFHQNIGFIHEYKTNSLIQLIIDKSPIITSVKPSGIQDVYDFSEPITNWGAVNGYLAHNCGEVPLSFYDSCRLASMILPSYVVDPFTKNARFDFDLFAEDVEKAQRLMDNIIDLERERIEAILEKINKEYSINNIESVLWQKILTSLLDGRRTGLGTLGLADALAMLNIPYSSPESIKIAEDIHKSLALGSYSSSIILAKERGCFTAYDYKREKDHIFIRRIYDKLSNKLQKEYEKYGRRNISNLSIAPTGTLAILTNYSSGIEPVFKLFYNRKRRVDENHPNKSFKDDSGDWWEEYKVLHPQFKKYLKQFGDIDEKDLHKYIEKSPYHNVTTEDIYPIDKIKLQSAIQQWIDHSISITHNVSEDTTYESIEDIYFKAWETGCKGSTVYRQNSRLGVLTTGQPEEKFKQHDSIKRPKDVPCDVYLTTSKGKKYVVCIGIIDNHPFELFAFDYNDTFKITEDKGILRRVKKGCYDLIITNGNDTVIKDITSKMSQSEEDRTRMISTALRHGADVLFVVEQLRKSKGDITTFSKVIARALSRYIQANKISKDICPVCNAVLVYEGGCKVCKNCGESKCE